MKIEVDNLEETYQRCTSSGSIKEKSIVDIELIKSLKSVSEKGLKFIDDKSKNIPKDSTDWTFVFRDYYEALRNLIEAYLLFDKIKADHHQCKNAYLCQNHPELELNWQFLEIIRLKRNAINYRGQLITYEEWKQLELNFRLHINKLKEEISNRLEENR